MLKTVRQELRDGAPLLVASSYASLILMVSGCSTGIMLYGYKYALVGEHGLSAPGLAFSNLVISLPLLLSFLPGILRDSARAIGPADRLILFISPLLIAGCCLFLGLAPRSTGLVVGLLVLVNASAVASMVTMNAMLAALAKRFGLSGRISALGILMSNGTSVALLSLTGFLATRSGFSAICFVSAGLALLVAVLGVFRPASLFPAEPSPGGGEWPRADGQAIWQIIRRLATDRPACIAALICFFWDFTPGFGTPLFYRYTGELQMSPQQFEFTATIGTLGGTLSAVAYLRLCLLLPLRTLLPSAVAVAVVGSSGLLFVSGYTGALAAALVAGVTAGIAKAGVYDLLYRASPNGLEGASVSLGIAATYAAGTLGDIVGSFLAEGGHLTFAICMTLATTAMIIPLVFLMPPSIIAAAEGEVRPAGPDL